MKNKVLVKIYVPELDFEFDVFIPVNEIIWKVNKMITKSISDLTGEALDASKKYLFINKKTNEAYDNNLVIIDTDIRNATELILLSAN